MFIGSVTWNSKETSVTDEFYGSSFYDILEKVEIKLLFKNTSASSIEIFEAEGKHMPRKLIASMRTVK